MVQLMDFILFGAEITENELEFLETVSAAFNIPQTEFQEHQKLYPEIRK